MCLLICPCLCLFACGRKSSAPMLMDDGWPRAVNPLRRNERLSSATTISSESAAATNTCDATNYAKHVFFCWDRACVCVCVCVMVCVCLSLCVSLPVSVCFRAAACTLTPASIRRGKSTYDASFTSRAVNRGSLLHTQRAAQ